MSLLKRFVNEIIKDIEKRNKHYENIFDLTDDQKEVARLRGKMLTCSVISREIIEKYNNKYRDLEEK